MTEDEMAKWLTQQLSEAGEAGYELTKTEMNTLKEYADNGINWTSLVMHDVAGES